MKYFLITLALLFAIVTDADAAVTASASRLGGVAPLSVHFNADLVEGTPTVRNFTDYKYVWNFDDAGGDPWGPTGGSRNVAYGGVASHVFESAGDYHVTLTVYNGSTGAVVSSLAESFTIRVTEPNTIYSTTKTTCVSTGSDFTGCPANAGHKTTSNLVADLPTYLGTGERVLLKRGNSWTINQTIPSSGSGVTIGAFGTGTGENAYGIFTNNPTITMASPINTSVPVFSGNFMEDWRVMDIRFIGPMSNYVISGVTKLRNTLMMRTYSEGWSMVFNLGNYRYSDNDYSDANCLYSNYWINAQVNFLFNAGERFSVLGNYMNYLVLEHVVRTHQSYLLVVSNNSLSGQGYGKHAMKIHGINPVDLGTYSETGDIGHRMESKFVVISDNLVGGNGDASVNLGSQNVDQGEPVSNILFERNRIISQYGSRPGSSDQLLRITCSYVTARNNIFDMTGHLRAIRGVIIDKLSSTATPAYNQIYDNTFYAKNATDTVTIGISLLTQSNTALRNNFVSFPGATGTKTLIEGTYTPGTDNVMNDTNGFVDPDNSSVLSRNFKPTPSSTALLNKGVTLPILDTFDLLPRSYPSDLGAYELASGADVYPPVETSHTPTSTLPFGTTSYLVTASINEPGTGYWGTTYAGRFDNAMTVVSSTNFSVNRTGLTDGSSQTLYMGYCDDEPTPNCSTTSYTITVAVAAAPNISPLVPIRIWPNDWNFVWPAGTGANANFSCLFDDSRLGIGKWSETPTANSADQGEAAAAYASMAHSGPTTPANNFNVTVTVVDGVIGKNYYARFLSEDGAYTLTDTIFVMSTYGSAIDPCGLSPADCETYEECSASWDYNWYPDEDPRCRATSGIFLGGSSFIRAGGDLSHRAGGAFSYRIGN